MTARLPLAAAGVLLAALFGLVLGSGGAGTQTPVAAPTIDSVTAAATSLTVAWTAPANVSGITAYGVRHIPTDADETDDANWTVVDSAWTTGSLEYAITGLAKGTTYDVQVRAVTTSDGQWSATTAQTTLTTAPGAPTLSPLTAGEGSLGVLWSEPADTGGTAITAYDLRYSEVGQSNWTDLDDAWEADDPTPTRELTRVVSGLSSGTSYDVQVRAESSEGPGDWSTTRTGTPVTDHGTSRAGATTIGIGALTSGSIDIAADWDYFKLVLAEEQEVVLFTRGSLDTRGRLVDAEGNEIVDNYDGYLSHGVLNFAIARRLAAGTYYLAVGSDGDRTGDYLLQTLPIPDSTGQADAPTIEVGPADADLGSVRNQIIGNASDVDWFRFELSDQTRVVVSGIGQAYSATRDQTALQAQLRLQLSADLRDAQGRSVTGVQSVPFVGDGFTLGANLAAGTWYVRVTHGTPRRGIYRTGVYSVQVGTVGEEGDALSGAALLTADDLAWGWIDAADDVDYFRLDVSSTAHVRGVVQGASIDLSGELLDADDDPLSFVDLEVDHQTPPAAGPRGFRFFQSLKPGTYYIKIEQEAGSERSSTGYYALGLWQDLTYTEFIDRCTAIASSYSDPLFGCQWYLLNTGQSGGTAGEDINIEGAWSTTQGAGINVVIVDGGVQPNHEDLVDNRDTSKDHDYTSYGLGQFSRDSTHGTKVAGVLAARDNDRGVRGVAPRATIYGFNLLLAISEFNRADALTREMATTAISNNSYGGLGPWIPAPMIWELAIERGIESGYGGKGVFYVFSAGNGALAGQNSNFDSFANHYGVTATCAVNHRGNRSRYSERGANLWVCAPSSDSAGGQVGSGITTTTGFRYVPDFGGTSSAAPVVSGVAALVRAVNTDLTWRDVKLILAGSARKNDPSNSGWLQAGPKYGSTSEHYEFNHEYGFGVVDATAAVNLAGSWTLLPSLREKESTEVSPNLRVPDRSGSTITTVSSSVTVGPYVEFVEFVEINVDINHTAALDLHVTLRSPAGTVSTLSEERGDDSPLRYRGRYSGHFRFGSARHLGEDPSGTWTLSLRDEKSGHSGTLNSWSITVYGHGKIPDHPSINSLTSGGGSLTVAWKAPDQDTGEPSISAYDVRYIRTDATDKADANWTVEDDAWSSGALSYLISGLPGAVSYDVQVRAENSAGEGDWSETVAETTGATPPGAPAITSVVPGNATLAVSWNAPSETGGQSITAYDVQHRTSAGAWTVVDSATTGTRRHTLSGLTNDTVYDVQVRAASGAGDGEWSKTETGKPRAVNAAPAFPNSETGAREVQENTPEETDIGAPVAATDADNDRLTYTISGSGASAFDIDATTGQLRTNAAIDHETGPSYTLTVTATDVAHARATQSVTITVTDVNEPATISGPQTRDYAENGTSAVGAYLVSDPEGVDITLTLAGADGSLFSIDNGSLRFTSPPDFEQRRDQDRDNVYEVTVTATDGANTATLDVTVTVTNVNEAPEIAGEASVTLDEDGGTYVGSYSASDPEGSATRWTLGGADAGDFSFSAGDLSFASTPDYEAAQDANRDNLYQVTLQASDGTNTARLPVTVTVGNLEEPGEVTLSTQQPQEGVRLTATLSDPDGRITGVSWQWEGPPGTDISGATSSSYKPVAGDVGNILRATVTYRDGEGSGKSAQADSANAVRAAPPVNRPPDFPPEETGTRSVRENTPADEDIGAPVAADDPDNDPLTYTLDSTGSTSFAIDASTGQLRTKAALDRESRASYRVTVTAADPSGLRDTQQVTITVADEDEPPVVSGETVVSYPSGGTRTVATYRANDPERETITWTLSGLDGGAFAIDGGRLRFQAAPDYDAPGDVGGDNVYELTVTAEDPAFNSDFVDVTVTVTEAPPPPPRRSGGGGSGFGPGPGEALLVVTVAVAGEEAPTGQRFAFALHCTPPEEAPDITGTFSLAAGQAFGRFVPGEASCSLEVMDDGGADRVEGIFTDLVPQENRRIVVTFTYGIVATTVALDAETVVEEAAVVLTIPSGSRAAPYAVLLETGEEHCEGGLELDEESIACHAVTVYDADGEEEAESVDLLVRATVTITLDAATVEELGGLAGVRAAREKGELRMLQRDDADSPWREIPFTVEETDAGAVQVVLSVSAFSEFALISAEPRLRTIPLHAGWNVVLWDGADGAAIADALGDLTAQVDVIYEWVAETQTWRSHRPGVPPTLSAFHTFTRGATYWLRAAEPTEWTVVGGPIKPPAAEALRLHPRWTEVVWRGADGASIAAAFGVLLGRVEVVYQWLAATQTWRSHRPGAPPTLSAFDAFQMDASYWVAVTEAIDWTVPLAPP